MKKIFMISGSFRSLEFPEDISFYLKKYFNDKMVITFIPAEFENELENEKFANKLLKCFEDINIFFTKVSLITSKMTRQRMKEIINESDIVFLLGGDTLKQNDYLNEYNLKPFIRNKQIIIGISAGAINMAKKVVLAKDVEDNIPELSIYDGIGLCDINIEPHCDFNNEEHLRDLKEASMANKIVVMHDNASILIDDEKIKYFGDYLILDKGTFYHNKVKISIEEFREMIN